jgi:serine/threonine-protein kinase
MKPECWQQLDKLFHAALEREQGERVAFLDHACAGDKSLRKRVEALLAAHKEAGSFIESPAIEVEARGLAAAEESADTAMASGKTLSHYRIISRLGSGGMGEVYLAHDTVLDRRVALKLLPEYFTRDRDRLRRFQQEARAASALNHPNIITIYEIGQVDGRHFIATEFVDGATLRQNFFGDERHTSGKQLRLSEVLDIVIQSADALAAAHETGIVHRDIKPENLMMRRRDRYIKVLDFGLAKLTEGPVDTEGSTRAHVKTSEGVVMGTVSYMSPEQARGEKVDARTDIWSLGVVLYELVAGCVPFERSTLSEVIALILEREPPPLARYAREVPAEMERIVSKALTKDRETRYQTAKDLLIDLRRLRRRLEVEAEIERTSQPREKNSEEQAAEPGKHRGRKAIDSIAVLPLINESVDPDTEYLADGITESIINSLSQLPKLRVMARGTVFRYKGQEVDPREVGTALSVRVVLAGRVLQVGDGVVIRTELVDTADGSQLWGEQYNRKLSDILALQGEIALEVAEKLRLKLSRGEGKRVAKRYTENTEAYQLYLKGRYFWNKATTEGIQRGIEYFQQAIEIDPSYALAYGGLADCYALLSNFGAFPPKDQLPKALAAAEKALMIDEKLAEAHTALAYAKTIYDWDWESAEREFKLAIKLKSNDEWSHEAYGWYLAAMGRFDESIAEMKRAQEIDPLSVSAITHIGIPFYYARQYDRAIEQFRKGLDMEPDFANARYRLGLAYVQKEMYEEAIVEFQRVLSASSDRDAVAALGHVHAMSNQRDKAEGTLAELKERAKQEYVPSYDMAIIHVGLSETAQAFDWLEKAYEERSYWLTFLQVDPILDSLRSDSRYTDLLRRAWNSR